MPKKIGRIICEISDFCFPLRHQTKTLAMEKAKYEIKYLEGAVSFLKSLDSQVAAKIMYNIDKSKYVLDKELFKKLEDTDIWEFRTLYNGIAYRLFAFWDTRKDALVIATHGFIKKTNKTPQKEIAKALAIRERYFHENKN